MDSVGGSSRNKFSGIHIQWGGGVVAEIFRARFGGGGGSGKMFPLTAVADPKFVLFNFFVLCFARIMSTLCPNVCRQTAPIGGGGQLPLRPVRLWWLLVNIFFSS